LVNFCIVIGPWCPELNQSQRSPGKLAGQTI
jgi:hypothetical protein